LDHAGRRRSDAFGAIRLISLSDGTFTSDYLDVPGRPLLWTADGRLVLRSMIDHNELRTVRAGETRTAVLFRLPAQCASVTLSGDAATFACTVLESFERDVWIARPKLIS